MVATLFGSTPPLPQPGERPRLLDASGRPLEDDTAGFLLPHQRTFAAVYNAATRLYQWSWDEAVKHSQENVLAMRRDAFITGCLEERYLQLPSLKWHLEAESPRDPTQQLITAELTRVVQRTARWVHFVRQLCEAIWYGRYANQMNWQAVPVNGVPRLAVVDHLPVNGDKIQFGYDGHPRVQVNAAQLHGLPLNPADITFGGRAPMLILRDPRVRQRFVIHKHVCDDADYFDGEMAGGVHGVGLRSRIYWLWFLRYEMLGWAINHLKKIGVGGILIFYYEEGNAASEAAAEAAAKNAGERYALAMPRPRGQGKDTTDAKLLPFSEAGVASLTAIISDYFERHIERLIIGQVLSSKAESTGLGSAVGTFHENTKYKILQFDAANLADTLTADLVGPAQRWNFPQANFHVRFVFDLPDPQANEKMAGALQAFQMNVPQKADYVRALIGSPKPEGDDEIISALQLAAGQMQVQLQGQQAQLQMQQQAQLQQAQAAQQMQLQQAQQMGGAQVQPGAPAAQPAQPAAPQQAVAAQAAEAPVGYTEHAPAGGIDIGGDHFDGGEFIPGAAVAKATPQEKKRLKAKQLAAKRGKRPPAPLARREGPSQVEKAPPQAPERPSFVAAPFLPELMRFAGERTAPDERRRAILEAVYRMAKMTPAEFNTAAGKAWQRAPNAPGFNRDVAESLAARLIHAYRAKKRADVLNAGEGEGAGLRKSIHPQVQKAAKVVARRSAVFVKPVAKGAIKHYLRAAGGGLVEPYRVVQHFEGGKLKGYHVVDRRTGEAVTERPLASKADAKQVVSESMGPRHHVASAAVNLVADVLGEYFMDFFKSGLEQIPQLLTGRKAPKRVQQYQEIDRWVAYTDDHWKDEPRAPKGGDGDYKGGQFEPMGRGARLEKLRAAKRDAPAKAQRLRPARTREELDALQRDQARAEFWSAPADDPDDIEALLDEERNRGGSAVRRAAQRGGALDAGLDVTGPTEASAAQGTQGGYADEDSKEIQRLNAALRSMLPPRHRKRSYASIEQEYGSVEAAIPPERRETWRELAAEMNRLQAGRKARKKARRKQAGNPFDADLSDTQRQTAYHSPTGDAVESAVGQFASQALDAGLSAVANRLGEKTAEFVAPAAPKVAEAAGKAVAAAIPDAPEHTAKHVGELAAKSSAQAATAGGLAAGTAAASAGLSALTWPVAVAVGSLVASAAAGYAAASLLSKSTADTDEQAERDALEAVYGEHRDKLHADAVEHGRRLGLHAAEHLEKHHDEPTLKHWLVAGGLTLACPLLGSFISGAMLHRTLHAQG